jgi:hypothetical protein
MWDKYRSTFPLRYLEKSYFDEYLETLIDQKGPQTALDIGGGVTGTAALNRSSLRAYLLDPFVNLKPDWVIENLNWETDKTFDLVLARGSINYLSKDQVMRVPKLLKPRAVFLANTFLSPPPTEWNGRPYRNAEGEMGTEFARYRPSTGTVEHRLAPEKGEEIVHSFFYYTSKDYEVLLPGAKILPYKGNSAIIRLDMEQND